MLAAAAALVWHFRVDLLRSLPLPPAVAPGPHARYAAALRASGLDDTELGRAWLAAADAALEGAQPTKAGLRHAGVFTDAMPRAASWRFPARRGQRVVVTADTDGGELFLDLLDADARNVVASATAGSAPLAYDVRQDGEFLLRAQAELLRSVAYAIAPRTEASLEFPLSRVSPRAAHGPFGTPRDGGRRRHEGIDIFAPRGTPAVAAVDGWVTGAATNRLGGNVVWLWSPARGIALYYAHLDRHAVTRGDRVAAGDVVGYVGTTGNARGTPPHLHFGVYARGEGAIDPAPFVIDPPGARTTAHAARR